VAKRNIYTHEIELKKLKMKNAKREEFASALEKISYRGYEVEDISDGRKIVITKPGGKFAFGGVKKEDFMVFIYNPMDKSLWLISHKDILSDLQEKGEADPKATIKIINDLEKVFKGTEPDEINISKMSNLIGELPEALLKAYKWIWGQEDVNYPTGKGRLMSFESIEELRRKLRKKVGHN
jgi:hypothetical protein